MELTRKYHPSECPSLHFFQRRALDALLKSGISGLTAVGYYGWDNAEVRSVKNQDLSHLLSTRGDERILVAASDGQVQVKPPLVGGVVGIYPKWHYFAIEGIHHPVLDACYFSQIDETVLRSYGGRTREQRTGERRFDFIGSDAPFDPIHRGLATWYAYATLCRDERTQSDVHLMVTLVPLRIRKIQGYARNKGIQEYAQFLDRIALLDPRINEFRQYHDVWAARQTKRQLHKSAAKGK